VSVGGEVALAGSAVSTDGGFFFDVTGIQSDMTLAVPVQRAEKPGSRVLGDRGIVFFRGPTEKKYDDYDVGGKRN